MRCLHRDHRAAGRVCLGFSPSAVVPSEGSPSLNVNPRHPAVGGWGPVRELYQWSWAALETFMTGVNVLEYLLLIDPPPLGVQEKIKRIPPCEDVQITVWLPLCLCSFQSVCLWFFFLFFLHFGGIHWHCFQTVTLGFARHSVRQKLQTRWRCQCWGFELFNNKLLAAVQGGSGRAAVGVEKGGSDKRKVVTFQQPRVAIPLFSLFFFSYLI